MSPEAERDEAERGEAECGGAKLGGDGEISPMIIAIDGPAGSGKSTLASKLAEHFGLHFIDTGLLYRAVALRLGDLGHSDPDAVDEAVAVGIAHDLRAEDIASPRLRGEGIGGRASQVAAMPGVRAALLPTQRRLAREGRGSVLAGRDIGTVVLPETPFKLFVTASLEARAKRRFEELRKRGEEPIHARVLEELRERDRRDEERAVAPMVVAPDADVVDTTDLGIEEAFAHIVRLIETRSSGFDRDGTT